MRLSLTILVAMSTATNITVLVEVEDTTLRRAKCVAAVAAGATEQQRDATVRAAALRAAGVDDGACELMWRRRDVASATVSARNNKQLALPGRAFAALEALDVGGRPLPLPTAAAVGGGHAAATAATTWDGSVALAMFLARAPELVLGKRVVELGSGTAALPGLAAALLGAASVELTDQATALPELAARAAALAPGVAAVAEVDWTRGLPDAVAAAGVDVVLASDTVWLDHLVAPFADCVAALLRRPGGHAVLYLAHQTRSAAVDELLFAAFRARGLRWATLPRSAFHPDFEPGHIAIFRVER